LESRGVVGIFFFWRFLALVTWLSPPSSDYIRLYANHAGDGDVTVLELQNPICGSYADHMPNICRYAEYMPNICRLCAEYNNPIICRYAEYMPIICRIYADYVPNITRSYADMPIICRLYADDDVMTMLCEPGWRW
jgi:hypothetical protein